MATSPDSLTIVNRGTQRILVGPLPSSKRKGKPAAGHTVFTSIDKARKQGEQPFIATLTGDEAKALRENPVFQALVASPRHGVEAS